MKKVLITGSVGGLFGEFVRRLIFEKGKEVSVVSVDRISNANKLKGGIYTNKSHSFYLADITDEHIMNRIFQFEEPDVVVHGAEETGPGALETNVHGTQNLLDCAEKYGVQKFIFRSSDKVYGALGSENDVASNEESTIWTETKAVSHFTETKGLAERLVLGSKLASVVVRGSNSYGPRQITSDKLIPKTVKAIVENKPIEIFGEGNELRDWIHAHDYSAALMTLLFSSETGIFNVGSGQEFSALEIVQRVCNAMERGHDLIQHIEDPRPRKDFRFAMNCEKMRTLGWKPGFKVKDGIKRTVEWYLLNQAQLLTNAG